MPQITLAEAEARLAALQTEYDDLVTKKSETYSISTGESSRSLSRRSLAEVREEMDYWDKKVSQLSRGGIRVSGITPK